MRKKQPSGHTAFMKQQLLQIYCKSFLLGITEIERNAAKHQQKEKINKPWKITSKKQLLIQVG